MECMAYEQKQGSGRAIFKWEVVVIRDSRWYQLERGALLCLKHS